MATKTATNFFIFFIFFIKGFLSFALFDSLDPATMPVGSRPTAQTSLKVNFSQSTGSKKKRVTFPRQPGYLPL